MIRRLAKVATPILFVVFLAAACSSDGFPTSYDDQEDPGTGLTLVQSNWLRGCEVGLEENLAEEANSICQCSYERLSGDNGIPFEDFVELNNSLRDNPDGLADEAVDVNEAALLEFVTDCIVG